MVSWLRLFQGADGSDGGEQIWPLKVSSLRAKLKFLKTKHGPKQTDQIQLNLFLKVVR